MLFTDAVASTEALARLRDRPFATVQNAHLPLLRNAADANGGREVKGLGDGLMVVFTAAEDALGCAVAVSAAAWLLLVGEWPSCHRHPEARAARPDRKVQPAVILTWIAKSAVHPCDGAAMVEDAVFRARRAAEISAATVLALDPFDADTAMMWRRQHGFIDAVSTTADDDRLPRLIVPLRASG